METGAISGSVQMYVHDQHAFLSISWWISMGHFIGGGEGGPDVVTVIEWILF